MEAESSQNAMPCLPGCGGGGVVCSNAQLSSRDPPSQNRYLANG